MIPTKAVKLFTLASLLVLGASSCKKEEQASQSPPEIPVLRLAEADTFLSNEFVASIEAVRNVEIRARVKGFLDQIFVDEGARVKQGQVLFQINPEEYKADLQAASAQFKTAQAEAKAAELEVNRVKLMVEGNVVAISELEVAKARHQAALAKMEVAKAEELRASMMLAHTTIKAPFDGIVDRIPFKAGSLIDEGALLTTVSDIESVYAYFSVSENHYLDYMKRQIANPADKGDLLPDLILADGSMYPLEGRIETVESEFDETTGSIAFRARFPNPERLLKHGASGKVRLDTKVTAAILIPQKAVLEVQDKNYVFVLDKENKVYRRSFIPRSRLAGSYLVESGLKPGEHIIYDGVLNIQDGLQVQPRIIDASQVFISGL
jgi:membrane fusion protein (multidrug efflux system)